MLEYEVKVVLNVEREKAEYLYDEIEALLMIGIENAVERTSGSDHDRLERVVTPAALTRYLSEALSNPAVVVEKVQVWSDHLMLKENIGVKIYVPNDWAINFGNGDDRLAETIDYLTEVEEEEEPEVTSATQMKQFLNGQQVTPIIGMIQYDQLEDRMKVWTGTRWEPVA